MSSDLIQHAHQVRRCFKASSKFGYPIYSIKPPCQGPEEKKKKKRNVSKLNFWGKTVTFFSIQVTQIVSVSLDNK